MTDTPVPPAAGPRPTYYADGTPLSIQLFTVEGAPYGPYVGLPLRDTWTPLCAHLFTRLTAKAIVSDLHRHEADSGMRAEFAPDGTLTFTWTEEYDGTGGRNTIVPDEHGRYAIGGLWPWAVWELDGPRGSQGHPLPFTAEQEAFALGAAEYKWTADKCTAQPEGLDHLYAMGRDEAHRVSLHRDEPATAPPISLAEFKRRAMQCKTFTVEHHRFPERSGPREVDSISMSRIRATRPGADRQETYTTWPKARLCRIEGNRITFLHDKDGTDFFTYVFPFEV